MQSAYKLIAMGFVGLLGIIAVALSSHNWAPAVLSFFILITLPTFLAVTAFPIAVGGVTLLLQRTSKLDLVISTTALLVAVSVLAYVVFFFKF
jgi:hypothetical protein